MKLLFKYCWIFYILNSLNFSLLTALDKDASPKLDEWKAQVPSERMYIIPRKKLEDSVKKLPASQRDEVSKWINQFDQQNDAQIGAKLIDLNIPAVTAWVLRYGFNLDENKFNNIEDMPTLVHILLCHSATDASCIVGGADITASYYENLKKLTSRINQILKTNKPLPDIQHGMINREMMKIWAINVIDKTIESDSISPTQISILSNLLQDIKNW